MINLPWSDSRNALQICFQRWVSISNESKRSHEEYQGLLKSFTLKRIGVYAYLKFATYYEQHGESLI